MPAYKLLTNTSKRGLETAIAVIGAVYAYEIVVHPRGGGISDADSI